MQCDCCGGSRWEPRFDEGGVHLGQCPDCDLLYVKELPGHTARMTEMEDGHYADEQTVLSAAAQRRLEEGATERFDRYIDLVRHHVPTGRWLDVGCGTGLLPLRAQERGFNVAGLELNADRRTSALELVDFPIHALPVEDAGFADDSFDVISLINVYSHLIQPSVTLQTLGRILRPGGVALVVTGEMTAGVAQRDMFTWNLGDHLHFLGERTMQRYSDQIGFSVVHHDRRWLPDEMASREWLRASGRSPRKNALKRAIDRTPGGLSLLRLVMLRAQASSSAHSSTFVLSFGAGQNE